MREGVDVSMTEVLRRRFGHGDPAMPLRHDARAALRAAGADHRAEWLDDVLMVISELVQNVSQHTPAGGELIVSREPGTVLVEVGDSSVISPRPRRPDTGLAGGRGLMLIEAVCRRWGVRTCHQGKAVWVQLAVTADPNRRYAL
jgi:hypothetical protein